MLPDLDTAPALLVAAPLLWLRAYAWRLPALILAVRYANQLRYAVYQA